MHSQSVVIIGAGPVGSLLAALLAERGCQVDVYERRPDMRSQSVAAGRSINLAVSARGLHALAQLGLDGAVLDCTVPMRGRRIHAANGTTELQLYGRADWAIGD
ncbi:MAG: FAD-dependent oxidoreductase [Myxococcales bacterium]|nr:FAD-dependent oxidoreductase [Myxococcales bacterium]